jgi:putative membrane-bound dehydrogenase-like protein
MRAWLLALAAIFSFSLLAGDYQMPKLPEGLEGKLLVAVPQVSEIVSVAASPDGRKIYIGEQHSACDAGKWGDIKMLYDADGDGVYERQTMFATETCGGQGMLCMGDTLYLVGSPYLTMFRDNDGDGVADERKNLVEGLGPDFNGGLHDHTVSGVNPGTDGWLYISVGDKGVLTAKGTDGKKVQLYGGGIVRVRPDGTDIEVYCVGLRNTMDVGIDPELNVFMRDNTNDGGGWNVRSTHIWQSCQYGYPNLFKNYVEEMLPCMEDHGGGSPCGCIFYNEPGLREEDRGKLLFCDWGRAIVYRYDLDRKGATYVCKQNEWVKQQNPFRAVDIQPDAIGNLYLADWGRGGWGKGQQAGAIIKVSTKDFKPTTTLPKFKDLDVNALIDILKGPSQTLRLLAQRELIARGEPALAPLQKIMESGDETPRIQRVFALWTYKQIAKEKAAPALLKLAEKPAFRELALRAVTDRKAEVAGVPLEPFIKALKDENAFVRGQAAVCLGRLGTPRDAAASGSELYRGPSPLPPGAAVLQKKEIAEALCEALGDSELQVRHIAMRALRSMEAYEECLKTAEKGSELASQFAFVALREIYTDAAADGLISLYGRIQPVERKVEALKAIGRLAKKEDEWKGNWWGTQPNTVGPFQKFADWSGTAKLTAVVSAALADKDEKIVLAALWALGCMRDASAVDQLMKLAAEGAPAVQVSALNTLMTTRPPQASPLFAKMLVDTTAKEADRKAALDALSKIRDKAADIALAESMTKLDAEFKGKKFDKTNGILPLARKALLGVKAGEAVPALKALIVNTELSDDVRTAAAQAMSTIKSPAATEALAALLSDKNPELVAAALKNIDPKGTVKVEKVREFVAHADAKVQGAALIALGKMKDAASAEMIATKLKTQSLQSAAVEGLTQMGPVGNEVAILDIVERIAGTADADDFVDSKTEANALACAHAWLNSKSVSDEARKKMQSRLSSHGGVISTWYIMGPVADAQDKSFETIYDIEKVAPADLPNATMKIGNATLAWKSFTSTDPNGAIQFTEVWSSDTTGAAFAYCVVDVPKECKGTMFFGSDDTLSIYVNGERIWNQDNHRGLNPEQDKIPATFKAGKNIVMAKVCNHGGGWALAGRIEGIGKGGKKAQQRDALIADAMSRTGNAAKGQEMFLDEKRANCIKCHTVNGKGGNVGPDLSSIGATKDKRYLIDSVLEPSKDIGNGYQPMKVTLKTGKVMFGVILNEAGEGFDLAMADAHREPIKTADVKDKTPVKESIMPEGQADAMTRDEFVDLITYLTTLKK